MHSLPLKTTPFLPSFNHFNPTNINPSKKSQFNSLKCFTNSNPNSSPITLKQNSQINRIIETQSNFNHNFTNSINKSPIQPKPISQIDRKIETHFQNQPNSNPDFTKPTNISPVFSKPISQINQVVETHFPKQPSLGISVRKNPVNRINKIEILSSEFKELPEPIDRVKRLLHYATLLSPIQEPGRIESNRVTGCTTQVWLEAEIDSEGLMRFRADSDSEITKGFCYCLVWALSGAKPKEVMAVEADDLAEMNVGFSGRSKHSRVNTWQNVLVGMQRRTEALVDERERGEGTEGFPSLLVKYSRFFGNRGKTSQP